MVLLFNLWFFLLFSSFYFFHLVIWKISIYIEIVLLYFFRSFRFCFFFSASLNISGQSKHSLFLSWCEKKNFWFPMYICCRFFVFFWIWFCFIFDSCLLKWTSVYWIKTEKKYATHLSVFNLILFPCNLNLFLEYFLALFLSLFLSIVFSVRFFEFNRNMLIYYTYVCLYLFVCSYIDLCVCVFVCVSMFLYYWSIMCTHNA